MRALWLAGLVEWCLGRREKWGLKWVDGHARKKLAARVNKEKLSQIYDEKFSQVNNARASLSSYETSSRMLSVEGDMERMRRLSHSNLCSICTHTHTCLWASGAWGGAATPSASATKLSIDSSPRKSSGRDRKPYDPSVSISQIINNTEQMCDVAWWGLSAADGAKRIVEDRLWVQSSKTHTYTHEAGGRERQVIPITKPILKEREAAKLRGVVLSKQDFASTSSSLSLSHIRCKHG